MNFQNKIKSFLLTLLLHDYKFNEVIKYFLLFCGKKNIIKINFCFMVSSKVCCLSFKNAIKSEE